MCPQPAPDSAARIARGMALLLAWAVAGAACSQERAGAPTTVQALINTVPVLDGPAGVSSLSRVDMVRWARMQRSALGLSVGLEMPVGPAIDSRYTPALSVGFRWRTSLGDSDRQLDVTSWRRLSASPAVLDPLTGTSQSVDPAQYVTRIELQFAKPKSMAAELGAIGMQLDGDAKLSLRVKHGGPMLYYRRTF